MSHISEYQITFIFVVISCNTEHAFCNVDADPHMLILTEYTARYAGSCTYVQQETWLSVRDGKYLKSTLC